MAAFLFVMASVALLTGLAGVVIGFLSWTTGRPRAPCASVAAQEQGTTTGSHG